MRRKIDKGDVVDDLEVLETYKNKNQHHARAFVQCTVCGRTKDVQITVLANHKGTTHASCGKGLKTLDKKFYGHWQNMRTRTTNTKYQETHYNAYKNLDSEDFRLFIDFYDYMYDSYVEHCKKFGKDNTTLDRINNNLGYSKGNIRWATYDIQYDNYKRSKEKLGVAPDGTTIVFKSVPKFSKQYKLSEYLIYQALNTGKHSEKLKNWRFKYI